MRQHYCGLFVQPDKKSDYAICTNDLISVSLEIDRSKFESIRKVSEEIQSALIIDDDDSLSSDNNIQNIDSNSAESETEEKPTMALDEFDSDNEYVM